MTLQEFVTSYTDKTVDFDGKFGGQCVDLYRQYCKEVLNVPQSPPVEGAKDIWNSYLTQYFIRIDNTSDAIIQAGDIPIWSAKYGPYGHVAIALSGTLNQFKAFSQNDPTGSKCITRTYSYKNVLGWLRPRDPGIPDNSQNTGNPGGGSMTDRDYRNMYYTGINDILALTKALSLPLVDGWADHPEKLDQQVTQFKDRVLQRLLYLENRDKVLIERNKEIAELTGKNNALQEQVDTLLEKPTDPSNMGALELISLALKAAIGNRWR